MKYTIWLDHNFDGWSPYDFDTIEECLEHMRSFCHTGGYRITRNVAVAYVEQD